MHCACAGAAGEAERPEPESPVFDESFALDAQLILGSLVTPATAARPPAQRRAAPAPQASSPAQHAQEVTISLPK